MELISAPRIIISGVASGVGKSLLTIGLATALRQKGISVSCCVVRPALLQASILRRITNRFINCLDTRMLSSNQILSSVFRAGLGSDLVLIEGCGGLYDGYNAGSLHGSDAEIARLIESPVVLVVDLRNIGNSVAALLRGYTDFAEGVKVVGAIGNRCAKLNRREYSAYDSSFYNLALESFGLAPLLGALPELDLVAGPPPAYACQARNLTSLPRQFFVDLSAAITAQINLDNFIELASQAPRVGLNEEEGKAGSPRRTRIAVAEDSCFGVCFQDNFDLLRFYGAEVVSFSPLADEKLPDRIGAVYFTGGAIAEYGVDLANNISMHDSIRDFARKGGVVYSEGSGTAYLAREFVVEREASPIPGVGVVPITCQFKRSRFMYEDVEVLEEIALGLDGTKVKGISLDEWDVFDDERMVRALKVARSGRPISIEGYSPTAQSTCIFSFLHFGSNPQIAKNLVDAAEVVHSIRS